MADLPKASVASGGQALSCAAARTPARLAAAVCALPFSCLPQAPLPERGESTEVSVILGWELSAPRPALDPELGLPGRDGGCRPSWLWAPEPTARGLELQEPGAGGVEPGPS